jgi:hypothetical protein
MTEGEAAILNRLADAAEKQAVTSERLTGVLERVGDHLNRMDDAQERAVASLKDHHTATLTKSDWWWRKAFVIVVVLIMLSNLFGPVIQRYMPFLKP